MSRCGCSASLSHSIIRSSSTSRRSTGSGRWLTCGALCARIPPTATPSNRGRSSRRRSHTPYGRRTHTGRGDLLLGAGRPEPLQQAAVSARLALLLRLRSHERKRPTRTATPAAEASAARSYRLWSHECSISMTSRSEAAPVPQGLRVGSRGHRRKVGARGVPGRRPPYVLARDQEP